MLCIRLLSTSLRCVPFGTSCTVGPCEVRKGCGKRNAALQFSTLHSSTIPSTRDVAAPVVAASYPVATARKQALQCSALPCPALLYSPVVALRPRSGQRMPADPAGKQALPCGAVLCLALPCYALPSAHAVKLCSHFFRLACFKLCQVVASELGAVVAKPFKHGRMHKRILHIRHVQNFGDNRH